MEKIDYLLDKTNVLLAELNSLRSTMEANKSSCDNNFSSLESNLNSLETNVSTIKQNIANQNLLINGNFKINQRGSSSYVSATSSTPTYMIDRWAMTWAGSLTSINDNSISIQFVRQYSVFKQMIENYKDFKGKTLTASFKIANLSATSGVYIRISDGVGSSSKEIKSANGSFFVTRTIDENATELNVNILNTNATGATVTLDIEYAKLEFGELATPFNPRPYAQELEMCKRYCLKLTCTNSAKAYSTTFAYNTTSVGVFIPCKLRTSPTIKWANVLYRSGSQGGANVTNLVVNGFTTQLISMEATTTANTGECGLLRSSTANSSYILFDSEIY